MLIWEGHFEEPFVSNAQLGYLALSTSFQAPEQRVLKCSLHSGEASWGLHTDENRDLWFLLLSLLFSVQLRGYWTFSPVSHAGRT